MTNHLVQMNDIEVSYPQRGKDRKVIFTDVDLQISEGEFVTVIGPSGCGKSTVLRLILGSQAPFEGNVSVDNKEVWRVMRDRGIVYQKYSIFPHLSVLDNIALGPILERTGILTPIFKPWKYFRVLKEAREEAMSYIESVNLSPDDAHKQPHELSGGMKQRVAIAQSLIMKPKVLMMDEPFSALDASTRDDMQMFILEMWEKHNMTIFFVTHEIEEAVFLGTRLLGLSQYWSDDNGGGDYAQIVVDAELPKPHPKPLEWKHGQAAQDLVWKYKQQVMDRQVLQHVREFDASHPDATQPNIDT